VLLLRPSAFCQAQRAGVINVASISGWSPQLAMSGQYGAAKASLIFDTERWALEFVPHGIRVNTVSPGSILVEGNGWVPRECGNTEGVAVRPSAACAAVLLTCPVETITGRRRQRRAVA
jgi:NAD(P)-dependent dehydrogenase (short-subunit alcohol dehydrogenase family)